MASLSDAVRSAIYDIVVKGTAVPTVDAISAAVGADTRAISSVFQALAASHVIVLQPSTLDIAWAPPFALTPTAFRSRVGGSAWHAPCAWDAFGIPAALNANDAAIEARCAWSGDPIDCGVERGRARGDAVIHLLVPAAHFLGRHLLYVSEHPPLPVGGGGRRLVPGTRPAARSVVDARARVGPVPEMVWQSSRG